MFFNIPLHRYLVEMRSHIFTCHGKLMRYRVKKKKKQRTAKFSVKEYSNSIRFYRTSQIVIVCSLFFFRFDFSTFCYFRCQKLKVIFQYFSNYFSNLFRVRFLCFASFFFLPSNFVQRIVSLSCTENTFY